MSKPANTTEIVQRLRTRGHLGGTIAQHRAIWRLPLPMNRVVVGIVLALAFSILLMVLRPRIGIAWGDVMLWWMRALELPGAFVPGDANQIGWFGMVVPVMTPDMPVPDANTPLKHGAVLVLLWWCMGWLSDAAKPLAFFVRLGVLVHAASVLFFMFWPASFTHTMAGHVASGLRQTWYLMLATPWIHLMTYYVFPFATWQRAALTIATLVFLLVLTPLQYSLHVALSSMSGLILLPLLNLMFGVMLPVVGVVALYGWGMSWATPAARERHAL